MNGEFITTSYTPRLADPLLSSKTSANYAELAHLAMIVAAIRSIARRCAAKSIFQLAAQHFASRFLREQLECGVHP